MTKNPDPDDCPKDGVVVDPVYRAMVAAMFKPGLLDRFKHRPTPKDYRLLQRTISSLEKIPDRFGMLLDDSENIELARIDLEELQEELRARKERGRPLEYLEFYSAVPALYFYFSYMYGDPHWKAITRECKKMYEKVPGNTMAYVSKFNAKKFWDDQEPDGRDLPRDERRFLFRHATSCFVVWLTIHEMMSHQTPKKRDQLFRDWQTRNPKEEGRRYKREGEACHMRQHDDYVHVISRIFRYDNLYDTGRLHRATDLGLDWAFSGGSVDTAPYARDLFKK